MPYPKYSRHGTMLRPQITSLVLCVLSTMPATAAEPDFARDVRPILAQFCFKCHGPDEKARKADLRLDDRQQALEHGAFVPGKPAESELVERVFATEADKVMPPPSTKIVLTDAQKQTLKAWIAAGAVYKPHWAFVKPVRPSVPLAQGPGIRNPIDSFVRERLLKAGLTAAQEAERSTLLRRVSLDLIGLPPTPQEVDAFEKDHSPDAYEKLVDRLLASPQYGERWARRWLDLARYADTNGYEKDRPRSIWPYRDWVIDALNADMPFDQLTIKQLAGDMLPGASAADRIATGFHRNTMLNEEGGIDPLEFRFNAMTDRVATTGTVWLGLTVGCAQCHTHKFDPIPHKEYYQFFACLNNCDEPQMNVPAPTIDANRAEVERQIAKLIVDLPIQFPADFELGEERQKKIDAAFFEWLGRMRKESVLWQIVRPIQATSNSPLLTIQPDDSLFVSGDLTKSDEFRLLFKGDFAGVTAIRVEAIPDARLPNGGPGAVFYEGSAGDFTLSEINALVEGKSAKFVKATHTHAAGRYTAQAAIDGKPQTGWSIDGGQGRRQVAVFAFEKPLGNTNELVLKMLFERHFAADIGRFRIAVTRAPNPEARATPPEIEQLLLMPESSYLTQDLLKLREHFYLETPYLAAARKSIDALRKSTPASPTTLVMRERPAENPRATFVHNRGEFLKPKDRVQPGTFSFLPAPRTTQPVDRLALARWLVTRDQPLTARVTVNRQWAAFFGRGLVRTTEDFGYQGEMPSHPELLDWLAIEFMDEGWSLKKLHRLIVTSATYRQDSRLRPGLPAQDANNTLLARGPRVRIEAEMVRDSALRVADLLCTKIGGPSVYPPQRPAEVSPPRAPMEPFNGGRAPEKTGAGAAFTPSRNALRRLHFTPLSMRRAAKPAWLGAIFPIRRCMPFLSLMTSPSLKLRRRSGGHLPACRMLSTFAFGSCFAALWAGAQRCRVDETGAFLEEVRSRCERNELDAKRIAGNGAADSNERAAWTSLARALMNLDEFVTKN